MPVERDGSKQQLKPFVRSVYLGMAVICGGFLFVWNVAVRLYPTWLTSETRLFVLVAIPGLVAGVSVLALGRFAPTLAPETYTMSMEGE